MIKMTFMETLSAMTSNYNKFDIAKMDNDKQYVFGWAQVSTTADGTLVQDHQEDVVEPEELEEAAYFHVLNFRNTGEQHNQRLRKKGKLIESIVFTKEKQAALGIPTGVLPIGWWVGYHIEDKETWEKVKSGHYQMFSIEGQAEREPMVTKSFSSLFSALIRKFNPYHGKGGRFSSRDEATSFTYSPGKSKAHDMAIAREKELSSKNSFRRINDYNEADKYASEYFSNKSSFYSQEEIKSGTLYTSSTYRVINAALRKDDEEDSPYYEDIKRLQNAISKSDLTEDVKLYRGLGDANVYKTPNGVALSKETANDFVGMTLTDKAFVSTSLRAERASGFAYDNVILEIRAKAGQKAYMPNGTSEYVNEHEAILQTGSGFRVTGTREESFKGSTYIVLETDLL